jgi:glutamine synthetase
MFFSKAELSRRTEEARPILERLSAAGCRFMQMEMPDNNGYLRGKIVPLAKGLAAGGTGMSTVTLAVKSGDNVSWTSPFSNWDNGFPKMAAVPDLSTASALPWKRDVAAVLCDFYMDDGSPCPMDGRHILRSAEATLAKLNYSAQVALEYELYIVEENDALMREGRFAELASFGRGLDFYSISKSPSFEDLAKEFMTRCEAVGIQVEAFHSELGHGMFEYTFAPQTALKAADDSVRAKLYLKQLCAERGLAACYMAAKFVNKEDSFSGCHHNFSLARGKSNAFWDPSSAGLSQVGRHAAAGVLDTMPAFNILYRPWANSYRRMNRLLWNPENASWGADNHTAAIRVVHGAVPDKLTRFEHRAPGPDVNPYLTIASILFGCIQGIREGKDPPPYARGDAMLEKHWALLPHTMPSAIDAFRTSAAAAAAFGPAFIEHLACVKQDEWNDFAAAVASPELALRKAPVTDWEFARYFNHA